MTTTKSEQASCEFDHPPGEIHLYELSDPANVVIQTPGGRRCVTVSISAVEGGARITAVKLHNVGMGFCNPFYPGRQSGAFIPECTFPSFGEAQSAGVAAATKHFSAVV